MSSATIRGRDLDLLGCPTCGLVSRRTQSGVSRCPRCNTALHARIPNSIARTWAFLLTAILLYAPANLLPVMQTTYLGRTTTDTIMSGVVYFLRDGDWPLALIIFTASIVVPLLKMATLLYLLVSVQRQSSGRRRHRAALYRITELVGRWSMVDVFVVGLLTALVQMGAISTIAPGPGAAAFAAVVILTMLAASSFDPRLIWDHERNG